MSPLKGFQKHTLPHYIAAIEKDCEPELAAILFLYFENRLKKLTKNEAMVMQHYNH